MVGGGSASSDTPVMKKRKLSSSPLLATPTRVLEQAKKAKNVSYPILPFRLCLIEDVLLLSCRSRLFLFQVK